MNINLNDDEWWLIRDAISSRIDNDDFYSTDENGNENVYDDFLKKETVELFDALIEIYFKDLK